MSRKHHAKSALHAARGPYVASAVGHGRARRRAAVSIDRSVLLDDGTEAIPPAWMPEAIIIGDEIHGWNGYSFPADDRVRQVLIPSVRAVKRVSGGRVR